MTIAIEAAGFAPVPGLGFGLSSVNGIISDPDSSARAASLLLIGATQDPNLADAVGTSLSDKQWSVRAAAAHLVATHPFPHSGRACSPCWTTIRAPFACAPPLPICGFSTMCHLIRRSTPPGLIRPGQPPRHRRIIFEPQREVSGLLRGFGTWTECGGDLTVRGLLSSCHIAGGMNEIVRFGNGSLHWHGGSVLVERFLARFQHGQDGNTLLSVRQRSCA